MVNSNHGQSGGGSGGKGKGKPPRLNSRGDAIKFINAYVERNRGRMRYNLLVNSAMNAWKKMYPDGKGLNREAVGVQVTRHIAELEARQSAQSRPQAGSQSSPQGQKQTPLLSDAQIAFIKRFMAKHPGLTEEKQCIHELLAAWRKSHGTELPYEGTAFQVRREINYRVKLQKESEHSAPDFKTGGPAWSYINAAVQKYHNTKTIDQMVALIMRNRPGYNRASVEQEVKLRKEFWEASDVHQRAGEKVGTFEMPTKQDVKDAYKPVRDVVHYVSERRKDDFGSPKTEQTYNRLQAYRNKESLFDQYDDPEEASWAWTKGESLESVAKRQEARAQALERDFREIQNGSRYFGPLMSGVIEGQEQRHQAFALMNGNYADVAISQRYLDHMQLTEDEAGYEEAKKRPGFSYLDAINYYFDHPKMMLPGTGKQVGLTGPTWLKAKLAEIPASIGGVWGKKTANAVVTGLDSYTIESMVTLVKMLREEGVDTTNSDALRAALNPQTPEDKARLNRIMSKANRRGITIGAVDTIFSLIGGTKKGSGLVKTVTGSVLEKATDAVGNAGGEWLAQKVTGENSPGDVVDELVYGFLGSAADVLTETYEYANGSPNTNSPTGNTQANNVNAPQPATQNPTGQQTQTQTQTQTQAQAQTPSQPANATAPARSVVTNPPSTRTVSGNPSETVSKPATQPALNTTPQTLTPLGAQMFRSTLENTINAGYGTPGVLDSFSAFDDFMNQNGIPALPNTSETPAAQTDSAPVSAQQSETSTAETQDGTEQAAETNDANVETSDDALVIEPDYEMQDMKPEYDTGETDQQDTELFDPSDQDFSEETKDTSDTLEADEQTEDNGDTEVDDQTETEETESDTTETTDDTSVNQEDNPPEEKSDEETKTNTVSSDLSGRVSYPEPELSDPLKTDLDIEFNPAPVAIKPSATPTPKPAKKTSSYEPSETKPIEMPDPEPVQFQDINPSPVSFEMPKTPAAQGMPASAQPKPVMDASAVKQAALPGVESQGFAGTPVETPRLSKSALKTPQQALPGGENMKAIGPSAPGGQLERMPESRALQTIPEIPTGRDLHPAPTESSSLPNGLTWRGVQTFAKTLGGMIDQGHTYPWVQGPFNEAVGMLNGLHSETKSLPAPVDQTTHALARRARIDPPMVRSSSSLPAVSVPMTGMSVPGVSGKAISPAPNAGGHSVRESENRYDLGTSDQGIDWGEIAHPDPNAVPGGGFDAIVSEIEIGLVGLDHEECYFLNSNGDIIMWKEGTDREIELTPEERAKIHGAPLFMHSHPRGKSFSIADVEIAADMELGEIRVIGGKYRYIMRPPEGGWSGDIWNKQIKPVVERLDKEITTQFKSAIEAGAMTDEEADMQHHHELWTRAMDETGLDYGREEWKAR